MSDERQPLFAHVRLPWIALVCLVLGGIWAGALGAIALRRTEPPPILRDLPPELAAGDRAFTERVAALLPRGLPEREAIRRLADQGFKPTWGRGVEREAVYDLSTMVCNAAARIWWRTDAQGRLVAVRARYGEEGCW